ncbi:fumarylacetoacetate hydrolase family protein [Nesterenkonia sp. CL21]|uniref:fumarylacetoacetate hydrolase family protein n=1 Tax=Nesterenkonia sp. CL21 TaxID=3064894 RepID=UPI0028785CD4|nr:fumarylacetoacetate hydrolase family protein [Nesterenkonia sp. CL21]MDS2173436.1 fumarylacetoacetate hydrolase family protein [Nesterenkonia sp. CL21]
MAERLEAAMTPEAWTLDVPFALARVDDGRTGVVRNDEIRLLSDDELGAKSLNAFLAAPDWGRLEAVAESADAWRPVDSVRLAAPVEPRQVLQTGANYREHVIELVAAGLTQDGDRSPEEARAFAADLMDRRKAEGEPYFFIGLPACVVGVDEALTLPSYSEQHDWELELAVVIGRETYRISAAEAEAHIAGYTIVNDITTRDLVFRKDMKEIGTDWYRSKNAPGFLPTGPYLVPAPFVDPGDLGIRLSLNGTVMQDSRTSDLLFDIPTLVAQASQTMPLRPGDLLLTGSPAGNGMHWGRMLQDDDVMVGSIERLGSQTVRCTTEEDT